MEEAKKELRCAGRPRSEKARRDILEAAYKLLETKGFHAVGSHEIASAAGVSSATLYQVVGLEGRDFVACVLCTHEASARCFRQWPGLNAPAALCAVCG